MRRPTRSSCGPGRAPTPVANTWNGWKPDLAPQPGSGAEATPATPSAEARAGAEKASPGKLRPDADGVVRSKTGWRKLLPDILGGEGKGDS